jgi:hypothetical protein
MKLIHHGGYNNQERESYKEIIFSNTLQSMRYVGSTVNRGWITNTAWSVQCNLGGHAGA